jgi:hypothetical protein
MRLARLGRLGFNPPSWSPPPEVPMPKQPALLPRLRHAGLMLSLAIAGASAQAATCEARAAERNLHGAAKNSFVKKCEKDAAVGPEVCAAQAAEKKLAGAAKTSFVKKCEKDIQDTRNAKAAPKG